MRLPASFSVTLGAAIMLLTAATQAHAAPTRIRILAAESVYGAVAADIAGPAADVESVLKNPAQDPHDFEANPQTARLVAASDIVILNGADYDPWMDRLLAAAPRPGREEVRVSDLVGAAPGANAHLWQTPATMVSVAQALTAKLTAWDAADAEQFQQRAQKFLDRMKTVQARVTALRLQCGGTPVTATEPVIGPLVAALGLTMRNERYQLAVMNGTEPRAGDVVAMDDDLRQHRVRLLFHNTQVSDAATDRLLEIARASHVPVVGVTETLPAGTDYPDWILNELIAIRAALAAKP
jgi:zinc/manganese transport system substrate-binding protein